MVLKCVVILVILVSKSFAAVQINDEVPSIPLRAGHLAQLIHRINEEHTALKKSDGEAPNLDISTDDAHKPILQRVLASLQKRPRFKHETDDVRIHVIKNPHVLMKYKESLRENQNSLASEDLSDLSSLGEADYSEGSKENTYFRSRHALRRNAVFRLGDKYDESNEMNSNEPKINGKIQNFQSRGDRKLKMDKNYKPIDDFDAKSDKKLGHNNEYSEEILPKNRRDKTVRQWSGKNTPKNNNKNIEKWEETQPIIKKLDTWPKPSSERLKKLTEQKEKKTNTQHSNERQWKNNLRPLKSEWEVKNDKYFKNSQTTYGMPTYKTTREGRKAKKAMPQISQYYQQRKPKEFIARSPFKGFGRTYIPFDGKKGIYAE